MDFPKAAAAALLLLWPGAFCLAADEGCTRQTVAVSVLKGDHQPATGLTPQEFRAEIKGKPIQVLSATLDQHLHRVVVVLDASGSMVEDDDGWRQARTLALEAIEESPQDFQAGLIVFDDIVRIRIPVQKDSKTALQALEGLPERPRKLAPWKHGHTAIWDALTAATELLDPPEFGDAIYLITDGLDNESRASLGKVKDSLARRRVRLFTEWFAYESLSEPLLMELLGVTDFLNMALATGGLVAQIPPERHDLMPVSKYSQLGQKQLMVIKAEARMIYAAIQFPYRLELALPKAYSHPQAWRLSISQAKNQRPEWVVAYPAQLEGCRAIP